MYLYHQVPEGIRGHVLQPLNDLRDTYPDIYRRAAQKYAGREQVMERVLPTLNCLWNDVLHFTAVHPSKVRHALREVGFAVFTTADFYEIDARILETESTVIYLCSPEYKSDAMSSMNFANYDPSRILEYSDIPDATKMYYEDMFRLGQRPLLYQWIPHILYRGSIQLMGIRTITV